MKNKVNDIMPYLSQRVNSDSVSTIIYIKPEKTINPSNILGFQPVEISALGAVITSIVSVFLAIHTIKKYGNDRREQQNIILRERKVSSATIAKEKIEKFYGPFNSLLEESRIIYGHFALKEKNNISKAGGYFRTLRYLIQGNDLKNNVLDEHDRELLVQIIDISDKISILIEKNSGYVDNPELHTLLGKLIAHYRILKCAAHGKLNKDNSDLEEIVFPLEINGALDNEIRKLKKTIDFDSINKAPKKINKSIKFYNKNHIEYFQKTYSIDMSNIYNRVRRHFKKGTFVLDAGCGVGRDTEYFIKHGYKVTSFDAAQKMVDLCNQYPFAFCELLNFDEVDFPPKFELVWACASLLHLNKKDFKDAIFRLYKSMKKDGIIYFSLKKHGGHDKKRDFYYHSDSEIMKIFTTNLKMAHIDTWDTSSNMPGANDSFVNYIFKK